MMIWIVGLLALAHVAGFVRFMAVFTLGALFGCFPTWPSVSDLGRQSGRVPFRHSLYDAGGAHPAAGVSDCSLRASQMLPSAFF